MENLNENFLCTSHFYRRSTKRFLSSCWLGKWAPKYVKLLGYYLIESTKISMIDWNNVIWIKLNFKKKYGSLRKTSLVLINVHWEWMASFRNCLWCATKSRIGCLRNYLKIQWYHCRIWYDSWPFINKWQYYVT